MPSPNTESKKEASANSGSSSNVAREARPPAPESEAGADKEEQGSAAHSGGQVPGDVCRTLLHRHLHSLWSQIGEGVLQSLLHIGHGWFLLQSLRDLGQALHLRVRIGLRHLSHSRLDIDRLLFGELRTCHAAA